MPLIVDRNQPGGKLLLTLRRDMRRAETHSPSKDATRRAIRKFAQRFYETLVDELLRHPGAGVANAPVRGGLHLLERCAGLEHLRDPPKRSS
jgi:hypothetical protein